MDLHAVLEKFEPKGYHLVKEGKEVHWFQDGDFCPLVRCGNCEQPYKPGEDYLCPRCRALAT